MASRCFNKTDARRLVRHGYREDEPGTEPTELSKKIPERSRVRVLRD